MKPFEWDEFPTLTFSGSPRLLAFLQSIRDALIPPSGSCRSVQGELLRANDRLTVELLRNGMGNYYEDEPPEENYYGQLLLFMLSTLIENRGGALSGDDVAYFTTARQGIAADRELALKQREVEQMEEEPSEAQLEELEALEATNVRVHWEEVFDRAMGCLANWCLANPGLIDRQGKPLEEGGVRNLEHLANPPPPAPPCPLCGGRGFIPQTKPSGFPELCSCKGGRPRLTQS